MAGGDHPSRGSDIDWRIRGQVLSRWKERVDSGATVPGAEPPLGFRNGGEQCALIEGQVQGRSRSVGEQEQRRSLQMRVGDAVYGAGGTWADTDQHHAGLAGQSSHYRRVRLRSGAHELETDCAGLIDQIEARPTSRDPDHPSHTVTRQVRRRWIRPKCWGQRQRSFGCRITGLLGLRKDDGRNCPLVSKAHRGGECQMRCLPCAVYTCFRFGR